MSDIDHWLEFPQDYLELKQWLSAYQTFHPLELAFGLHWYSDFEEVKALLAFGKPSGLTKNKKRKPDSGQQSIYFNILNCFNPWVLPSMLSFDSCLVKFASRTDLIVIST